MRTSNELYSNLNGLGDCYYSDIVEYRPDLGKEVTFSLSRKCPVHNWFYFKQGYSPNLVERFLIETGIAPSSWVLDPFCGVGTTLLVAKNMGFNCIGIDILPLAVFISRVKLRTDFDPVDIEATLPKISEEPLGVPSTQWPAVPVIDKAFAKARQKEILVYKERIQRIEHEATRELLLLCLLSVLGDSSKTKKDGGFLRIVRDTPERSLKDLFETKVTKVLHDIQQQPLFSPENETISKVIQGDARTTGLESNFTDCIITSPPYLNKTDYTRVYSIELCLAFVNSFEQLREIRYNSLRTHVEARYPEQDISLPTSLTVPLEALRDRHLSNPRHPNMIKGYFEDIALTLQEMKRVLKPGGSLYFVIWNSCFSGVDFDVDVISADIGRSIGLSVDRIIVARQKGTSAQQSRTYGERPLRESIVVFSKRQE